MYADTITDSMRRAINETNRRRQLQIRFNEQHGITPKTVEKVVHQIIEATYAAEEKAEYHADRKPTHAELDEQDVQKLAAELEEEMKRAAEALDFERAAELRDKLFTLRKKG